MNYTDAITYLKDNDIKKEDGTYYEFGEVKLLSSLNVLSSLPLLHAHQNLRNLT